MTIAGTEIFPLMPSAIAFVVAYFCSLAGVTGAFILLPLQMSLFGFTSPSVSATNHFYNLFAASAGAGRYLKEGRMLKPLALVLVIGTVPGIVCGVFIRIYLLTDPVLFKLFVGLVLLVLGVQILYQTIRSKGKGSPVPSGEQQVVVSQFSSSLLRYSFLQQDYSLKVMPLSLFSFAIGIIGGAYGVGGGVFTAAYLIGLCGLPVYTTAGATMFATLISSVVGVITFALFSIMPMTQGMAVAPDWKFGMLLGIGGLFGTWFGAKSQKLFPALWIKIMLVVLMLFLAGKYIWGFIR